MKIEKKTLKNLKNNVWQVESLNSFYFIDFKNQLEIENLIEFSKIGLFSKIIDFFKGCNLMHRLLQNTELFQKLKEHQSLTQADLKYLIDSLSFSNSFQALSSNVPLCSMLIDAKLIQAFIDKSKHNDILFLTLKSKEFAQSFSQEPNANFDDFQYLVQRIDRPHEVYEFCSNLQLIKQILASFLLIDDSADKLTKLIEEDYANRKWIQYQKIHDVFELISYYAHKDNLETHQELLRLNALNNSIHSVFNSVLSISQRAILRKALFNNENSQNSLQCILDAHLQNTFDFESLIHYLTKKEKKNLINI